MTRSPQSEQVRSSFRFIIAIELNNHLLDTSFAGRRGLKISGTDFPDCRRGPHVCYGFRRVEKSFAPTPTTIEKRDVVTCVAITIPHYPSCEIQASIFFLVRFMTEYEHGCQGEASHRQNFKEVTVLPDVRGIWFCRGQYEKYFPVIPPNHDSMYGAKAPRDVRSCLRGIGRF